MSEIELIAELTDICIRQAEVIKAQAYVLAQYDAEVMENEAVQQRERLRKAVGSWEEDEL